MNICTILIKISDRDFILQLAIELGVLNKNFDKISSSSNPLNLNIKEIGIAQFGEWCVLVLDCNPFLESEATTVLTKYSNNTEIFFLLTESTSAGLWFEYHVNGQLIRKWVEVESQVAVNMGEPLKQEPYEFFTSEPDEEGERDEWKLFELCEKVTQICAEKLFSNCLTVYMSCPPVQTNQN